MNFHPILVHFPIALLSIYSILELVRFKKLTVQVFWFYTKAVLAVFGTLSAYVAYASGDERSFRGNHIFELHKLWATTTVVIFTVIAVYYLIELLKRNGDVWNVWCEKFHLETLWAFIVKIEAILLRPGFIIFLALAGLLSITITGALGGSLMYGPNVDPFVTFIYQFINK